MNLRSIFKDDMANPNNSADNISLRGADKKGTSCTPSNLNLCPLHCHVTIHRKRAFRMDTTFGNVLSVARGYPIKTWPFVLTTLIVCSFTYWPPPFTICRYTSGPPPSSPPRNTWGASPQERIHHIPLLMDPGIPQSARVSHAHRHHLRPSSRAVTFYACSYGLAPIESHGKAALRGACETGTRRTRDQIPLLPFQPQPPTSFDQEERIY